MTACAYHCLPLYISVNIYNFLTFGEFLGLKKANGFWLQRRQSDLYELGDRLSEKLMEQKEEMMVKMGNWSCVLKELRMVDEDMELDLEAMLNNIKGMNIRDSWLLQQTIEDTRTCYAVSTTHTVQYRRSTFTDSHR